MQKLRRRHHHNQKQQQQQQQEFARVFSLQDITATKLIFAKTAVYNCSKVTHK